MSNENLIRYRVAMEVFVNWFNTKAISLSDLAVIDTKMREKYGVDSSSIYRPDCLLCVKNRVNMSHAEGGESLEESDSN